MEDLLVSIYRLINIYNSKNRIAHMYECGVSLYPAQTHMIETIGSHEGITLTRTAAMLFVTKAAVSQCVKQLCSMGLVIREDKKTVGGAQELRLTDKGRMVFAEHHSRHKAMTDEIGDIWKGLSDETKSSIKEMMKITEEHIVKMEE